MIKRNKPEYIKYFVKVRLDEKTLFSSIPLIRSDRNAKDNKIVEIGILLLITIGILNCCIKLTFSERSNISMNTIAKKIVHSPVLGKMLSFFIKYKDIRSSPIIKTTICLIEKLEKENGRSIRIKKSDNSIVLFNILFIIAILIFYNFIGIPS